MKIFEYIKSSNDQTNSSSDSDLEKENKPFTLIDYLLERSKEFEASLTREESEAFVKELGEPEKKVTSASKTEVLVKLDKSETLPSEMAALEKDLSPLTESKNNLAQKRWKKAGKKVIALNEVVNAFKEPVRENNNQILTAPYVKRIINDLASNKELLKEVLDMFDILFYDEKYFSALKSSINVTNKLKSLNGTIGAILSIMSVVNKDDALEQLIKDGLLVNIASIELTKIKNLFDTVMEHPFTQGIINHEISELNYDYLNKVYQLNKRIKTIEKKEKKLSTEDKEKLKKLKTLLKEQNKFAANNLKVQKIDRIVFDLRNELDLKPTANLHDLIMKGMPIIYAIIDNEQNYSLLRKAVQNYTNYQRDKTKVKDLKTTITTVIDLVHKDTILPLLFDINKILEMQKQLRSSKANKVKLLGIFLNFIKDNEKVILDAAMGDKGLKKLIPKILKLPNIKEKLKPHNLNNEQLRIVRENIISNIIDSSKDIIIVMLRDHKEELKDLAVAYDEYKSLLTQYPPANIGEPEQTLITLFKKTTDFLSNLDESINSQASSLNPATKYISQYIGNIARAALSSDAIEDILELCKSYDNRKGKAEFDMVRKMLIVSGMEFLVQKKDIILDHKLLPNILASTIFDKNLIEIKTYRDSLYLSNDQVNFIKDFSPIIVTYLNSVAAITLSEAITPDIVEYYLSLDTTSKEGGEVALNTLISFILSTDIEKAVVNDGILSDMVSLILEDSDAVKATYLSIKDPKDSLVDKRNTIIVYKIIDFICHDEDNNTYFSHFVALALRQPESHNLIKAFIEYKSLKIENSDILLKNLTAQLDVLVNQDSLVNNEQQRELIKAYEAYKLSHNNTQLNNLMNKLEQFVKTNELSGEHPDKEVGQTYLLYREALKEEEKILSDKLDAFLNNTDLQEYIINPYTMHKLIDKILQKPDFLNFVSETQEIKKSSTATSEEEQKKAIDDRKLEIEVIKVVTDPDTREVISSAVFVVLSQPEINRLVHNIVKYSTSPVKDESHLSEIMYLGAELLAKPDVQDAVVETLEQIVKMALKSEILAEKIKTTGKFFKDDITDLVKIVGVVLPPILNQLNDNLKSSEKTPSFKKIEELMVKATALAVTSAINQPDNQEKEWKKWSEELFSLYKKDPQVAEIINDGLSMHKDAIAAVINTALDSMDDNKFKFSKSALKFLVSSGVLDGKATMDILISVNNSQTISEIEDLINNRDMLALPGLVYALGKVGVGYAVGRVKEVASYFLGNKNDLTPKEEIAPVEHQENKKVSGKPTNSFLSRYS